MIFLNPAVLFGLLAASIPVVIHLLNLRKLKRIEFSTLTFLKELQKNKIRKVKLKQWLLLALRVMIILLFVTAFARPTLEGLVIGGTTSAAKTTAVFILDDTFSMSVIDQQGSYFNHAKETIKDLLIQLNEGDDAALILVSEKNDKETLTTKNRQELSTFLSSLELSYSTGTLHEAVLKAAEVLAISKNFNKEIYVFSDFQEGSFGIEGTLTDLSQLLDEKVKIYSFNYSGKDVFNAGIDALKVNSQIFEKDKPVNFSVTVTNYSNQTINNAVVSLFINGERSSQQSFTLNEGESRILSMDAVVKSTGFIDVFTEIEDDELLHDNKRYASFFVPETIPAAIFTANREEAKYVELAVKASEERQDIKIDVLNLNQISSFDINKYKAVIIIGSPQNNHIDRLKAFLSGGGGLILMPAQNDNLQEFRSVCSAFGLPIPKSLIGAANNPEQSVVFGEVDFNHPIFQNIFSDKEKKQFESPDVFQYFQYSTEGKGRTIISLLDGSGFLNEFNFQQGKIFLFNSAPSLAWSNLPVKSIFVPLINKSIYYLAAKNLNGEEYTTGDLINVNISGYNMPQLKVRLPDAREEIINIDQSSLSNYFQYGKTSLAGIYKFSNRNVLIQNIPVNVNPVESKTTYLPKDEIEKYLTEINFKGTHVAIGKNENPVEMVLKARFGSELWKYFIITALLLALIEMTIARNTKKELVEVTSS
jgi:uncharacterized membrane protein